MASNTSATGGFLAPLATPAPIIDDSFEDQLQSIVVGITGLSGSLVRPRWQQVDPKQPIRTGNWCAIGLVNVIPDASAVVRHFDVAFNGYDELQRHETLEILASFYGPGSSGLAETFRDGFSIAQNREALFLANMGYVDTSSVTRLGELVNQGFILRADVTFRVRRIVIRNYPVLTIKSGGGTIFTDQGSVTGAQTGVTPFNAVAAP